MVRKSAGSLHEVPYLVRSCSAARLLRISGQCHHGLCASSGNRRGGPRRNHRHGWEFGDRLRLASLARRRNVSAVFLVRSTAKEALQQQGAEHVIVTAEGDFENRLGVLADELGTTAVFDGVGGDLIGRIAPSLPMNSTIYFYGFLGGAVPVSLHHRPF